MSVDHIITCYFVPFGILLLSFSIISSMIRVKNRELREILCPIPLPASIESVGSSSTLTSNVLVLNIVLIVLIFPWDIYFAYIKGVTSIRSILSNVFFMSSKHIFAGLLYYRDFSCTCPIINMAFMDQ